MTTTLSTLADRVRCTATYGAKLDWDKQSEWQQQANGYSVQLRYKGRQLTVDYWMGQALTREPDAASVLSSLLLDASACDQSFEEWCGEFGYDTDSRTAESTYQQCVKIGNKLQAFLGDDYEEFRSAENDI